MITRRQILYIEANIRTRQPEKDFVMFNEAKPTDNDVNPKRMYQLFCYIFLSPFLLFYLKPFHIFLNSALLITAEKVYFNNCFKVSGTLKLLWELQKNCMFL